MSGGTFATKGSAGAASQTVWMQSLADRLTMGMRWTEGNSAGGYQVLTSPYSQPCLFANQHLNYNTSFGAFITAPDGTTNTAQHITEDNSNGTHYIGCMVNQWFAGMAYLRMAGVYKADTRTRICFEARNLDGSGVIDVGFDLSGGQIAYGPIVTGTMLAVNQEIHPVVGFPGWWLCILDMQLLSTAILNEELFRVFLDNGSGTGSRSISYVGDNSSGVWGWKTSILPTLAWKINTISLFNDFTNLSRVDVTNSKLPGFDFYQQSSAPWQNWQPPQAAAFGIAGSGSLSITGGTILNIPAGGRVPANSTIECALGFACQTTPGNYVGRGFVPPFYIEANYTLGTSHAASDVSNTTWWGTKLEFIVNLGSATPNRYMVGSEVDFNDWIEYEDAGGFDMSGPICGGVSYVRDFNPANLNLVVGPHVSTSAHVSTGCPPVYASLLANYSTTLPYSYSGGFWYTSAPAPNAVPPGSTWHTYTYGTTTVGTVSVNQPPVNADPEQFHTYGILMVPYDPISGSPGSEIHFYDGGYVAVSQSAWGPNTTNPWMALSDWQQVVTWFNPGGQVGSGFDFNVDWIRVSQ